MTSFQQQMPNAIIYDEQELFAVSFSMMLDRSGSFESVSFFSDQKSLELHLLNTELKDTWLFLDPPTSGGIFNNLIGDIRRFSKSSKIIILTSLMNRSFIRKILKHQIDGLIGKYDSYTEIVSCIKYLYSYKNNVYISQKIKLLLQNSDTGMETAIETLTPRELEILKLVSEGLTLREIALELSISNSTIITHKRNMLRKSGMHSFLKLIAVFNDKLP